ncbi:hypothetical protein [Arthrobacter sp.]|uniref:hypothetical protein n=1 Tax=Arthrobacter sp. TaxID=1667 RepID=UPI003A948555
MTKRRPRQQPQPTEGNEWLRRLDRISEVVDAWRRRAENPMSSETGSSLGADSVEGLSVENPVWYSMCISSEHLDFAINAMRATSTMYPSAYMTVARTAFVAAVNAVWVLAPPTRQERRGRALRLRADDLRVQLTSFRDMQIPEGKPEEARTGLLEQLRERQANLQKVATALGVQEDVTKMRFHQTGAIDWVAHHMHGVDDDLLVGATQAIWRSGSAAAHAQYHFGIMRLDRNELVREESGGSIVRLRGDLDNDVGPAIAAATMTLSEAFRLYDLRRVVHARS